MVATFDAALPSNLDALQSSLRHDVSRSFAYTSLTVTSNLLVLDHIRAD
jgi:hypothetical protein